VSFIASDLYFGKEEDFLTFVAVTKTMLLQIMQLFQHPPTSHIHSRGIEAADSVAGRMKM
jgi:hypothetical protein